MEPRLYTRTHSSFEWFKTRTIQQGSAVADEPVQRAASRRTWCKQVRWTLSVQVNTIYAEQPNHQTMTNRAILRPLKKFAMSWS